MANGFRREGDIRRGPGATHGRSAGGLVPVFEPDGFDVRMVVEDAEEFRAAVAAVAEDACAMHD
jgi:hypothetical protein